MDDDILPKKLTHADFDTIEDYEDYLEIQRRKEQQELEQELEVDFMF